MSFQIMFSYGGVTMQKYSTYESAMDFAAKVAEHNPGQKLRIISKTSDGVSKVVGRVWFDQSGLHQERVN